MGVSHTNTLLDALRWLMVKVDCRDYAIAKEYFQSITGLSKLNLRHIILRDIKTIFITKDSRNLKLSKLTMNGCPEL